MTQTDGRVVEVKSPDGTWMHIVDKVRREITVTFGVRDTPVVVWSEHAFVKRDIAPEYVDVTLVDGEVRWVRVRGLVTFKNGNTKPESRTWSRYGSYPESMPGWLAVVVNAAKAEVTQP